MAGDEREEERQFLAELEARSGRDLAAWMAAIAAQGFADKNETIDWLRAQGFPFARASWLERIHNNGGRPIYMDEPPAPAAEPRSQVPAGKSVPAARAPSRREAADLEKLLAAAKGYRPLYELLEAEIRRAIPGVGVVPKAGYIAFVAPREFAALTLHATELRLGFDLGDRPFDDTLLKARMRGPGAAISHMLILTDARQVNADLINLIKAANARING
jgi:hypothetical protein